MNNSFRILTGHILDVGREVEDESVQVCMTSPPYYGLRAYKSPPQVWDGHPQCTHVWQRIKQYKDSWRRGEQRAGFYSDSRNVPDHGEANKEVGANRTRSREELRDGRWTYSEYCVVCNAWRGELGQEPSPALYVAHLVQCFEEVKRMLRRDGVLLVNIGDSHYNYRPGQHDDARAQGYNREPTTGDSITLGWEQTCKCYAGKPVPCQVLDPFSGRGTTGSVAVRFGRNALCIELKPEYARMTRKTISEEQPLWVNEEQ